MTKDPIKEYIKSLEKELIRGDSTELTHYATLKFLIESLNKGIYATIAPKRIECGAPDFIVKSGEEIIGCIEAKDVGVNLNEAEKTDQIKRYLNSISNLILTNFLEFRWFLDGVCRSVAFLGIINNRGKIIIEKCGPENIKRLILDFLSYRFEPVAKAKDLSLRMARLAKMIRDYLLEALKIEPEDGNLHNHMQAFRDILIPYLTKNEFADMYAQTISYGLFAARCNINVNERLNENNAAYMLPETNPFLRKLFYEIAGPELDDSIAWVRDLLIQLLNQADMEAIFRDFAKKRKGREDPVVHFYETFLQAYDPKIREIRGVYYTPEPVVSFIVRSLGHILKDRFNRNFGLADENALILDPAAGTGTFLYSTIDAIYQNLIQRGQEGGWDSYVSQKLLPRIFGFELLMAPYTIAHLKLGLLLKETKYNFSSSKRLGVFLTNCLEDSAKKSEALLAGWIAEEANAATEIKRDLPIMVVLGNPPYSGHSSNISEIEVKIKKGDLYPYKYEIDDGKIIEVNASARKDRKVKIKTFIGRLLLDYYIVDGKWLEEKNPKWLQDDYVKFIRFGQWRIERTGYGILAFITNHSYLDSPTFCGMRQSLIKNFSEIYLLDLHGNARKKERCPDGSKDENVFDTKTGVCIGIFIKHHSDKGPAKVFHSELWGLRKSKYKILSESDISSINWKSIQPQSPYYLFKPQNIEFIKEYNKGWKITDIIPINSVGIVTSRDNFAIALNKDILENRIEEFRDKNIKDDYFVKNFKLGKIDLLEARKEIRNCSDWKDLIFEILYRPFDKRYIFYNKSIIERSRFKVMSNILSRKNLALLTCRQQSKIGFYHVFCSANLVESCAISLNTREITYIFPLYEIFPDSLKLEETRYFGEKIDDKSFEIRPNLNINFIKEFEKKLCMQFIPHNQGDIKSNFGPLDIFYYIYAILHSHNYRLRYAEFLKTDFPRLPLTSDRKLFSGLIEKGAELVSLHLMKSSKIEKLITKYPVKGSDIIDKGCPRYLEPGINSNGKEHKGRIFINNGDKEKGYPAQFFEGIEPQLWNFQIGGHKVLQKWLKDRKEKIPLEWKEQQHYQKIVVAIKETIKLMSEIDSLITSWPID